MPSIEEPIRLTDSHLAARKTTRRQQFERYQASQYHYCSRESWKGENVPPELPSLRILNTDFFYDRSVLGEDITATDESSIPQPQHTLPQVRLDPVALEKRVRQLEQICREKEIDLASEFASRGWNEDQPV